MKNQNDLIVTIVTVVLALIAIVVFYFTKPEPKMPPPPEKVITTTPTFPAGDVQFANSLPGGSGAGGARPNPGAATGGAPRRGGGQPVDAPMGVTGAGG